MKGTVDRIEGLFAVCQMDNKTMMDIEVSKFTVEPRTGDTFQYEDGMITMLPEETEERAQKVESLFNKLKKKK